MANALRILRRQNGNWRSRNGLGSFWGGFPPFLLKNGFVDKLTIATQELTIGSLSDRLEQQQRDHAKQKLTINERLRRAFEKRSERYLENPDQLRLDFGNTAKSASAAKGLAETLEQAASALTRIVVPELRRRSHAPRKSRYEQLPAHLPRSKSPRKVGQAPACRNLDGVTNWYEGRQVPARLRYSAGR